MISRKPSRSSLPHTITLFNSTVIDGPKIYQPTIIRYVRYDFRKQTNVLMTGNTNADALDLLIFNGVSVATDDMGAIRKFVPAHIFLQASDGEKIGMWTLNAGDDYVGIGIVEGPPSKGGEDRRKDYSITVVDPKFGADKKVHHWEISGA